MNGVPTGTMIRAGAPAARATAGIVLLHGRGGTAADILRLLDHAGLPGVAAIAPEAPGQSWWPTSFLAPAAQMEPHVARGVDAARAALDTLLATGLPRHRIWLAGFSQGACLALETFARAGEGWLACWPSPAALSAPPILARPARPLRPRGQDPRLSRPSERRGCLDIGA